MAPTLTRRHARKSAPSKAMSPRAPTWFKCVDGLAGPMSTDNQPPSRRSCQGGAPQSPSQQTSGCAYFGGGMAGQADVSINARTVQKPKPGLPGSRATPWRNHVQQRQRQPCQPDQIPGVWWDSQYRHRWRPWKVPVLYRSLPNLGHGSRIIATVAPPTPYPGQALPGGWGRDSCRQVSQHPLL